MNDKQRYWFGFAKGIGSFSDVPVVASPQVVNSALKQSTNIVRAVALLGVDYRRLLVSPGMDLAARATQCLGLRFFGASRCYNFQTACRSE